MWDYDLLLVLPVPIWDDGKNLRLEGQSCNGLEQWANNFESLVLAAPIIAERAEKWDASVVWRDVAGLACADRLEIVRLPYTFRLGEFLRAYRPTRRVLSDWIRRGRYLHFAVSGLVGDWSAVAALEAAKVKRPYAVFTDRVEHEFIRRVARRHGWKRKARVWLEAPLVKRYHARIFRRAALGLWHGHDCFSAYHSYCANSYLVHDIHTKPGDGISPDACRKKAEAARTAPELRVCYAGRADLVKAPLDWVRAIGKARECGAPIRATWIGDGPLRDDMIVLAKDLGLSDAIDFPGYVAERDKLLTALREAHLFAFTHITPESPRCLIEALISGTPIVGYESEYARDLVAEHGGGRFVPVQDWRQLGETLAELTADRGRLAQLIEEAGRNGARFNDAAVFRERSDLMKKHLTA